MAERVFCVDFGSAYTKVALASRDPTAISTLIECAGAEVDFWVPTVAAGDRRGSEPRLGVRRPSSGSSSRWRNRCLHELQGRICSPTFCCMTDRPRPSPLDALLQSDEVGDACREVQCLPRSSVSLPYNGGGCTVTRRAPSDLLPGFTRVPEAGERIQAHVPLLPLVTANKFWTHGPPLRAPGLEVRGLSLSAWRFPHSCCGQSRAASQRAS